MPFVHLERELWDLRDATGREITPDAPERRGWLLERGAVGRLHALALCALHHALFDLGVVGITEDRRMCVSGLYVARNEAGRAVDALAGQPLLIPRPR